MRVFESGANRDDDAHKLDFEGFLSPTVLQAYAEYMHVHRFQEGHIRDSDNWQRGMPISVYMKSMWRHFFHVWTLYRKRYKPHAYEIRDALCALLFNVMGMLYEIEKERADEQLRWTARQDREGLG